MLIKLLKSIYEKKEIKKLKNQRFQRKKWRALHLKKKALLKNFPLVNILVIMNELLTLFLKEEKWNNYQISHLWV